MDYRFSDDGSYSILGIKRDITVFQLLTGSFKDEHIDIIEKYKCRALGFELTESTGMIDLNKIKNLDRIIRIHITFHGKNCEINFPKYSKKYKNLIELSLDGNIPKQCDVFKYFPSLKFLYIKYNKNITSWTRHKGIVDLVITDINVKKLMNLSEMESLKRIQINKGKLESLEGIEGISSLETILAISLKKITNLDALLKCEKLENILFSNYKTITDWGFLSKSIQIKTLSLETIDNLNFIFNLPKLEFLYFKKNLDKDTNQSILHKYNEIQEKAVKQKNTLPFYKPLI